MLSFILVLSSYGLGYCYMLSIVIYCYKVTYIPGFPTQNLKNQKNQVEKSDFAVKNQTFLKQAKIYEKSFIPIIYFLKSYFSTDITFLSNSGEEISKLYIWEQLRS